MIRMVDGLMTLIVNVYICTGTRDGWIWKASGDGVYSVRSAYAKLSGGCRGTIIKDWLEEKELISFWKAPTPFKVIATAWKILKSRIPTCVNLARRNVQIPTADAVCPRCLNSNETVSHAILFCANAAEVWDDILRWIDYQFIAPESIVVHFRSFTNLMGIWICVTLMLWKGRNECRFGDRTWDSKKIAAEIKARIWSWSKAFNVPHRVNNFQSWFSSESLIADL